MASEPPKVFISLQPCRPRLGGMDRCSDQPQRLSTHYSGMGLSARAPGIPKRTEALDSVNPPLDGAVVLLEHVVQIWYRPMAAILGESAFGFELRDGDWIRGVPSVLITRGAGWFAPPSALTKKRWAAAASCLAERRKSRVAPVESTAR